MPLVLSSKRVVSRKPLGISRVYIDWVEGKTYYEEICAVRIIEEWVDENGAVYVIERDEREYSERRLIDIYPQENRRGALPYCSFDG